MTGIFTVVRKIVGRSVFLHLALLGMALSANAIILPDTVHLDEVVIASENIGKYQAGAKIETLKGAQIELLQDGSLDQVLNRLTPVSFKTVAGGLSTIRFRGTSPDHTSINFEGININSLTLGHSNVSNIPMFLFDNVGIQYGGSSAVNGSGNIGGAINLGLENYWVKGFKAEFRTSFSSIGEQLYGTKIYMGNGQFEAVTRAYYYYNKNNFKYYYAGYKDFETGNVVMNDVQRNATIENKGIIQEFNYKFSTRETLKLLAWVEDDWHLIQQSMANNASNIKEPYEDFNVRIRSSYNNQKHRVKYRLGAGYVYDNAVYNNSTNKIQTQRLLGDMTAEYDAGKLTSFKAGVNAVSIFPNVYAYSSSLVREDQMDIYLLVRQTFLKRFVATLNLRQGWVTGFNVPFTPAIGVSYLAYSSETSAIKVLANVAKNYRVPTFNDRFWLTGGNPDLLPERAMNYELGFKYSYCRNRTFGNLGVNAFYMDVDQWLLWKNLGSYWAAQNEQRVVSKGVELSADAGFDLGRTNINSGVVYAFTSTQRVESDSDSPALFRQMEYVPLHTAKLFSTVTYKMWSGGFDAQMVPWQYTNEEPTEFLDGYFMLNINARRKFELNSNNNIQIMALLNNLLNVNYQSSYGYAMPRFNFKLSVTYNFK